MKKNKTAVCGSSKFQSAPQNNPLITLLGIEGILSAAKPSSSE